MVLRDDEGLDGAGAADVDGRVAAESHVGEGEGGGCSWGGSAEGEEGEEGGEDGALHLGLEIKIKLIVEWKGEKRTIENTEREWECLEKKADDDSDDTLLP